MPHNQIPNNQDIMLDSNSRYNVRFKCKSFTIRKTHKAYV